MQANLFSCSFSLLPPKKIKMAYLSVAGQEMVPPYQVLRNSAKAKECAFQHVL